MNPGRREFLAAAAAFGASALLPPVVRAQATPPPWSIGFEGVTADLPPQRMTLRGIVPEACRGTLYRNGPALYERGGQRYGHWFDPDGMVQAFRIDADGIEHRGRFVRTEKFRREAAAGRFLYDGAGSRLAGTQPLRNNESINTANISLLPCNGELLALWEAGSPYRVDPQTLETHGRLRWNDDLDGVPFSAHPHRDEAGNLWNIGAVPFAGRPTLVLYRLDARGQLRQWRVHSLDFAGYMHDFVLTPRYLVALNSSLVIGNGNTFVDSMHWEPGRPSQLLVFDREDLSLVSRAEVPAAFVFHFGNAWEDGDSLLFTACQYGNAELVKRGMARLARQERGPYHDEPELLRYRLWPQRGRATVERLGIDMEFPGFDQRQPFRAQPLFGVGGQPDSETGLSSAVQRVDPQSGDVERFDYGDGFIVEEPLFIPGPDGGYLIHSWLDYRAARSGLSILRAAQLAAGPIAQAQMDRVLPLGFHGCFLSTA